MQTHCPPPGGRSLVTAKSFGASRSEVGCVGAMQTHCPSKGGQKSAGSSETQRVEDSETAYARLGVADQTHCPLETGGRSLARNGLVWSGELMMSESIYSTERQTHCPPLEGRSLPSGVWLGVAMTDEFRRSTANPLPSARGQKFARQGVPDEALPDLAVLSEPCLRGVGSGLTWSSGA